MIGFELIDFVFVLNDEKAVATFIESATLTIGINASVAAGPAGRTAEVNAMIGSRGVATTYAYSKSRGLYIGLTAMLGGLFELPFTNKKVYERKLKAKQLLNGDIPPPREADSLMRILNSEKLRPDVSSESSRDIEFPASALHPGPAELSERGMIHELPMRQVPIELPSGDIHELPQPPNQNPDRSS